MGVISFFEQFFKNRSKSAVLAKKKAVFGPQQLQPYLEQKKLFAFSALEKPVFSKLSEIKFLQNRLKEKIFALKEKEVSLSEGNTRLRKVVKTSQSNLVIQMNYLIEKLEPPVSNDLNELAGYAAFASDVLSKGVFGARKNIVYAKTILEGEVKEIGEIVKALDSAFAELKTIFEKSLFVQIKPLKEKTVSFNYYVEDSEKLAQEIGSSNSELENFLNERQSLLSQLNSLKNSPEMVQVKALEKRKNELLERKKEVIERVVVMFGECEKPIRRFLQLASSGKYVITVEEQELLRLYLHDPNWAIRKDPKAVSLKKMLSEIEALVKDSKIVLKEKEKQKRLESLARLREFDFFGEVFWNLNSIDVDQNNISAKLKEIPFTHRVSALEGELSGVEKKIVEKKTQLRSHSVKIAQKNSQIVLLKQELEKELNRLFGEEIEIAFEPIQTS